MKSEDCELKNECLTFLADFPERIPHRCRQCTDTVKFVLERLKELGPAPSKSPEMDPSWWNSGAYDD